MVTMLALLLALQETGSAPAPPSPSSPPACSSAAHRGFDFWVGDWDVRPTATPEAEPVARSWITRKAGGCAILEQWQPKNGRWGISVNALREDGRWHQRWVGGDGAIVDFVGGPEADGTMVLEGIWRGAAGPGTEPLVRMTFRRGADGSVRQHGQLSQDDGQSWTDFFDFTYTGAGATPPPTIERR